MDIAKVSIGKCKKFFKNEGNVFEKLVLYCENV